MTQNALPKTSVPVVRLVMIGLIAGLVGSVTIWLYEYVVLYRLLHQGTLAGVVQHTALLVFGPGDLSSGVTGFVLGAIVHCATGITWAMLFALTWPFVAARVEATLAGLFLGIVAWLVMHVIILAIFSPDPPVYTVYTVINGFMSHMVAFAVPMALTVKHLYRTKAAKGA